MQIVVLAGGLGTRLRPLTSSTPKSMIPVNGRPFLEYQLDLFKQHGIRDVVLCVGHCGDQVKAYFGDGRKFHVDICYAEERDKLMGTAGAVKNAEALLADEFFLTYGDSYLRLDYGRVMCHFLRSEGLGLMVVYPNANRYDRSNVIIQNGRVRVYDKTGTTPGMRYINYGVSVLRKDALRFIPGGEPFSQEDFYQILIDQDQLLAFETYQRFYEIGSSKGLEEFRRLAARGAILQ